MERTHPHVLKYTYMDVCVKGPIFQTRKVDSEPLQEVGFI